MRLNNLEYVSNSSSLNVQDVVDDVSEEPSQYKSLLPKNVPEETEIFMPMLQKTPHK